MGSDTKIKRQRRMSNHLNRSVQRDLRDALNDRFPSFRWDVEWSLISEELGVTKSFKEPVVIDGNPAPQPPITQSERDFIEGYERGYHRCMTEAVEVA